MSAAHELVERGFEVEVHEAKGVPGGKARTIYVASTGTGGRPDLPGEHGFRFFPSFYVHLPDTMKRIPFAGRTVFDNLVQAAHYLLADGPKKNFKFLVRFPRSLREWRELLAGIYQGRELGIGDGEMLFFVERLLTILTSCQERRLHEYEKIDWWRFIGAADKSHAYQTYLGIGLTRSLVALKAQEASTRTVGDILVQLMLGVYSPFAEFDRVLNGPTSERWLEPWLAYLVGRGVRYVRGSSVAAIDCGSDGKIRGVTVEDGGGARRTVHADYYVAALPVETMAPLVDDKLRAADPRLAKLHELRVAWMNGIQLFLKQDRRFVGGHANYVETPSALTSISQEQFFAKKLPDYGDGSVHGCLSIDISDWDSPTGTAQHPGPPLKDYASRADVFAEVRRQLQAALDPQAAQALDDANIHSWFLDPDIELPNPSGAVNLEPLLINTAGSWADRPEATTRIPNLFLAADYVRTYTDLATMEGANEAARRAVNGVIAAAGSSAAPCRLWPLHEPAIFAPARLVDYVRWKLGLPHVGLGRETTRELLTKPALPRHRRTHRVADAHRAAPPSPVDAKSVPG
jgi:uncharacterized protein with NAD-binding domain and iron-sulfur cluster